jgi:diadenosine tetraphosphate (Ap4A) HIT family hydrolase
MNDVFATSLDSVYFEDNRLFVALARDSITKGHTVVVWKVPIIDINQMATEDYEYLMDVVNVTRKTLKDYYSVEKVYLLYMDETNHVHFHLIPRYKEVGFSIFNHTTTQLVDFPDANKLALNFKNNHNQMIVEN